MPGKKYKAFIIESEAGWGTKTDSVHEFDTVEERDTFVREYNEKHNPDMGKPGVQTPDWYMVARKPDYD